MRLYLAYVLPALVCLLLGLFPSLGVTQSVAHVPRFEYSASLGCGDVFFQAMNPLKTEVLRIEVDIARLPSSAPHQVFDLAALPAGVVVDIGLYRHQQINRPNCDDVHLTEVGAPPNPSEVWRSIAGRLEIERGSKGVRPEEPWLFVATIRLLGARFRGPAGTVEEMPKPFIWEGLVGWQAG